MAGSLKALPVLSGYLNPEGTPLIAKKISLVKFIFLGFFCVCGGPYGMIEESIGEGYPLMALVFILGIPWFYSLPLALASAEMGSAMPNNDGFVLWIQTGFGPFWAFVSATLNWFNYLVNNAVYPVLFMNYLVTVLDDHPFIHEPIYYYAIQFGLLFVIFLLNLAGVDFVGNASTLFAIFILSPFFVMFFWVLIDHRLQGSDIIMLPPKLEVTPILNCFQVVLWGYAGYETLGSIVEGLKDPDKYFAKAMVVLIIMSIGTYVISFLGAVSLDRNYPVWNAGYFAVLAEKLGGYTFKIIMIVAAMVSSIGTYNALLCTSSQALRAMGKQELLGSRLIRYRHPYFDTPWTAIFINSVGAGLFSLFSFSDLVLVNNILYSVLLLIIFGVLIRLRYSHRDMERPYIISKSNALTIILVIPPCLLSLFVIFSAIKESPLHFGVGAGIFLGACVLYFILWLVRRREVNMQPQYTEVST